MPGEAIPVGDGARHHGTVSTSVRTLVPAGTAALLAVAVLAGCGPVPAGTADLPPPATPQATTSAAPTGEPATSTPESTAAQPPAAQSPAHVVDTALHLWPFADRAAAAVWQKQFRSGGAQPWHLDSADTALGFVQGYLRFPNVDRVTSKEVTGAQAWIGVGFRLPNGKDTTAAVLHLTRYGTEEDSPWGVVGTRDTTLVVSAPAYGAQASWPLTVRGTISGVDESLRVRVLGPAGVVGETCCAPAGGDKSPWTVAVSKQGNANGPLAVVASTGGHVADVERFALTAVRG